MITDKELEEIEKIHRETAKGIWGVYKRSDGSTYVDTTEAGVRYSIIADVYSETDARFVANSHQDVPKLISEIKFLKGLVQDLSLDGAMEIYKRGLETAKKRIIQAADDWDLMGHEEFNKKYGIRGGLPIKQEFLRKLDVEFDYENP